MIVRATSDLHLSQATAPLVFAALDELRAHARAHGGVTVLCGDIFDQAVSVHMPTFNRLVDVLHGWPGDLYVLVGNHDQYGTKGRHCMEALDHSLRVTVVDRPIWTCLLYTSDAADE